MKNIIAEKLESMKSNKYDKFFSVKFVKKNGELRKMNCRFGVKKHITGVGMKYYPKDFNLLTVFDMVKREYRMINLNEVQELVCEGTKYTASTM